MTRARAPYHLLVKPIGPICNLDCDYCFYLKKKQLVYPDETSFKMTDEIAENLVRQYIDSQPVGVKEVSFGWQGGEPTLMGLGFYRRIVKMQKKYARSGMTVSNSLQTNGVLLDDDWCSFLHDENFLVGLSVDGPEELHNRFRKDSSGKGSFARVMAGLEALKRNKVEFNTLTVVQSDNSHHPVIVYDFLREVGSTFLQFIPIVEPTGDGDLSDRTVEPEQFGRFLCGVFDRWLELNDVGKIFVQLFDVTLGTAMGYPSSICVHSRVCGRSVAMEHNGDLFSCDHYVDRTYFLGNIASSELAEMVDGEQQTGFGVDKGSQLPATCRSCEFLRNCYGACPKDRISKTPAGEPGLNYLCEGYRKFFDHSLPTFERMAICVRSGRPASEYPGTPGSSAPASPGRNSPCPCGSGRKYKRCCMPGARK